MTPTRRFFLGFLFILIALANAVSIINMFTEGPDRIGALLSLLAVSFCSIGGFSILAD